VEDWITEDNPVADFRKDNGRAIRQVCAGFCRALSRHGLFEDPSIAIDGSKLKAVNNRDKNITRAKMERRMVQIEESVAHTCSSSTPPTDGSHRRRCEPRRAVSGRSSII
jgi:hypothetical protein